jgi:hypothetical protein
MKYLEKYSHPLPSLLVSFAAILVLSLALAACAGQAGPSAETPASGIEVTAEAEVAETEEPAPASTATPTTEVEAPSDPPQSEEPVQTEVSFTKDVLPLFDKYCIRCHGGNKVEEGLSLTTYAEVMAGSQNGSVIIAGDPGNSLLAQMIVDKEMPKRGAKPNSAEVQTILDWIAAGALDN